MIKYIPTRKLLSMQSREVRKGKRMVSSSKFDRELKRLESSINCGGGALRRGGRDKAGWEIILVGQ